MTINTIYIKWMTIIIIKIYKKLLKRIILNISNIRSSFALIIAHDDHFSANLKGMMHVVPDDVLYVAMWQIRNLSSYSILSLLECAYNQDTQYCVRVKTTISCKPMM